MNDYLRSEAALEKYINKLTAYAVVFLDMEGNVVSWNDGARILKGYRAEEITGKHFSVFYTPEAQVVGHPERELAAAAALGRYEEEGWRVRNDGTRFWAHVIITAVFDDARVLCGYGKILRDVTLHKQITEQSANVMKLLELTARTDYLTGLDNRRSFDKALSSAMSGSRQHDSALCVAMIDLDRFKNFNDEFGHQAGDLFLKEATAAWRTVLRPADFIARYGGEEFVVVLTETATEEGIRCMDRLREATPPPLTCSVGLARWNGEENRSCLLGRADHALYQAKEHGRNRTGVAMDLPAGTKAPSSTRFETLRQPSAALTLSMGVASGTSP
jgi:diguanylate cyclase (GGDEF)-like protein/PAS domain S-box-containing protein